jgi:DNA repair protein RadC
MLAQARPEELVLRSGIGMAKAAGLIAAFHLSTRAGAPERDLVKLHSPEDIAAAARSLFVGVQRERLMLFVCDSRDRIRKTIQVADGCLDQVIMPTREILNAVLRNDGRGFALVHNHPSGDPDPSRADEQATFALLSAASTVGLRFFDHVVVAGSRWASITSDERGG